MPGDPKPNARGPHRGRPAQNRSLERGIEVLRTFRPGVDLLGNAEIAERTGLSKATVSRLTQTLVTGGLLSYDRASRAYRLAAATLSLAHAMRIGSPILRSAGNLMRAVAEAERVNVGLATADRDAMVYLESVRYNRRVSLRTVLAGQRIPIELTSLGHAHLSALDDAGRQSLLALIRQQRGGHWPSIERDIKRSLASIGRAGCCWAAWQPGVVAVATPIVLADDDIYALNISVTSEEAPAEVAARLMAPLLALRTRILEEIASTAASTA